MFTPFKSGSISNYPFKRWIGGRGRSEGTNNRKFDKSKHWVFDNFDNVGFEFSDEVHGQPISETRVIGGHNASRGEYPHLVSLQHVGNDFAHHTCGGTILNELWVLTAAHCYLGRIATGVNVVVAGRHNLYELENTEQVVRIKYIIVHNKFDM